MTMNFTIPRNADTLNEISVKQYKINGARIKTIKV